MIHIQYNHILYYILNNSNLYSQHQIHNYITNISLHLLLRNYPNNMFYNYLWNYYKQNMYFLLICSMHFLSHILNSLSYYIIDNVKITIHNFYIYCQHCPNNIHQYNSNISNLIDILDIIQNISYIQLDSHQNQYNILPYKKNNLSHYM